MKRTKMISSAAALLLGASAVFSVANAAPECKTVRGGLEETLVPPPTCASPVDLCSIAQIFGQFKGQANFTATNIIVPPAEAPSTGVVFVIGDTIISNARLEGRVGTVFIKNHAAFRTAGGGDLTDTQVIVGGTDGFANATGSVRVTGTIGSDGTGTATYEGTVCLP